MFAVRDEIVPRITAKALYLSASLFNHSCAPNCVATFEGDCVSIRAIENISAPEIISPNSIYTPHASTRP